MAQQQPAVPQQPAAATKNSAPQKGTAPAAAVKNEPDLPEERFWIRYSPHHELPLSSVSSFGIHVLILGLLLLCASLPFFSRTVHEVPVEAVRFEGGGGGKPHGVEGGTGSGSRPPEEIGAEKNVKAEVNPPTEHRPDLEHLKAPDIKADIEKDGRRVFNQPNPAPSLSNIADLDKSVRIKFGPRTDASKGRGGSGSGGGRGDGRGTGEGSGTGPGRGSGNLTQREKRMIRWTMHFDTASAQDYLAQLRGLGAILAVPINEEKREFKVINKLTSPAKLEDVDIDKINRIYWVDERPEHARDIMFALGVKLQPNYFAAFFPLELEGNLLKMEMAHANGRPEDAIEHTHFIVKRDGSRYVPVFQRIEFKK